MQAPIIHRRWRTHDGESRRRRMAGGGEPPRVEMPSRPATQILDDLLEWLGPTRYVHVGPVAWRQHPELPYAFAVRGRRYPGDDGGEEMEVGGRTRAETVELRSQLILALAKPTRLLH
jgi:hypothetical protein